MIYPKAGAQLDAKPYNLVFQSCKPSNKRYIVGLTDHDMSEKYYYLYFQITKKYSSADDLELHTSLRRDQIIINICQFTDTYTLSMRIVP